MRSHLLSRCKFLFLSVLCTLRYPNVCQDTEVTFSGLSGKSSLPLTDFGDTGDHFYVHVPVGVGQCRYPLKRTDRKILGHID